MSTVSPYLNIPFPKLVRKAFLIKRLHSITGLFFILFLIEHLLTNSESALFIGEDGISFIKSVNFLQSLPYLECVELFCLGVPLGLHALLGFYSLFSTVYNSLPSNGSLPALPFARNIAFTLQRVTALFLLVGGIAHVTANRFLLKPERVDSAEEFFINVSPDTGLLTLAPRINATLVTADSKNFVLHRLEKTHQLINRIRPQYLPPPVVQRTNFEKKQIEAKIDFVKSLKPTESSIIAITPDFGTSCLLLVRDLFKSWYISILYTVFVLMAAFHAGNGLWTFMITWGITENESGRRIVRIISYLLISFFSFCGLSCIFGTYWFNLFQ